MKRIILILVVLSVTFACQKEELITPVQTEQTVKPDKKPTTPVIAKATQQQSYTVNAVVVQQTKDFNSISANSSFSVAASNTGTRTANFQVRSTTSGIIGSFDVPAGLSYTPVYYFDGDETGNVRIIVTKDNPSGGAATGTISVSN